MPENRGSKGNDEKEETPKEQGEKQGVSEGGQKHSGMDRGSDIDRNSGIGKFGCIIVLFLG